MQAIKDTGGLTGDIKADRVKVKDALAAVKNYPGITGAMTFNPRAIPRNVPLSSKSVIAESSSFTSPCVPNNHEIEFVQPFTGFSPASPRIRFQY